MVRSRLKPKSNTFWTAELSEQQKLAGCWKVRIAAPRAGTKISPMHCACSPKVRLFGCSNPGWALPQATCLGQLGKFCSPVTIFSATHAHSLQAVSVLVSDRRELFHKKCPVACSDPALNRASGGNSLFTAKLALKNLSKTVRARNDARHLSYNCRPGSPRSFASLLPVLLWIVPASDSTRENYKGTLQDQ